MAKYKVTVGTNNRTFQTFANKAEAITCAKNCVDCGFNDVYVAYGNGNPVPKTPRYTVTYVRDLGEPTKITIMTEAKPHFEVTTFNADTIKVVGDTNGIDFDFYREFWLADKKVGRYASSAFYFDM